MDYSGNNLKASRPCDLPFPPDLASLQYILPAPFDPNGLEPEARLQPAVNTWDPLMWLHSLVWTEFGSGELKRRGVAQASRLFSFGVFQSSCIEYILKKNLEAYRHIKRYTAGGRSPAVLK